MCRCACTPSERVGASIYLNIHLSAAQIKPESLQVTPAFLIVDNSMQGELSVTSSYQIFCFLLVTNISYVSFDCQLVVTEPVLG